MNTSRSAFTLMEMLVVIALLVTLMGMGAAGMRVADNMSKETRTRSTIQKLNQFVMEKYASYQYRRVPGNNAQTRLQNLYNLMRYEMPDHWSEVNNSYSPYRIRLANGRSHVAGLASAELLYQIVMGMPEAESAFNSLEIADTDGNGLNEFVDGWGNPIYFIRWPAGHYNEHGCVISKIQLSNDTSIAPCPFESAFRRNNSGISNYAVFPLIISAGQDRETGINQDTSGSTPCSNTSVGSATDASAYYDNITNHNL